MTNALENQKRGQGLGPVKQQVLISPRIFGGGVDQHRIITLAIMQIPFFMIKQSNDMISLIDGHDQRL